jgi:hypothetical protein
MEKLDASSKIANRPSKLSLHAHSLIPLSLSLRNGGPGALSLRYSCQRFSFFSFGPYEALLKPKIPNPVCVNDDDVQTLSEQSLLQPSFAIPLSHQTITSTSSTWMSST